MHIAYVEISNFRKLLKVRIDLAETTTLFVGANNSEKNVSHLGAATFPRGQGKALQDPRLHALPLERN